MTPTKSLFPLHFTKRYFQFLILVLTVSSVILSVIVLHSFTQSVKDKFGKELFAIAIQLEIMLPGSFEEILEQQDALDKPVDEQVKVINSVLQPTIQQLSRSHPGVGMGYYDKELNHVVAKGTFTPSSLIRQFHDDYPSFDVYGTGTPKLMYHRPAAGLKAPVLYQIYPIYRDGKLVGHTWANIRLGDVYATALHRAAEIIVAGMLSLVIVILFSWHVFRKLGDDLKQFAVAVSNDNLDASIDFLPELKPLVQLVREQKEKLAQKNQQLQQLALMIESSNDAIIGQTLEGIITSWNRGAQRIYGYTAEEVTGRPISILIPPGKVNDFMSFIEEIKGGREITHLETECIRKDGTVINVSVAISPIRDIEGTVVGASAIARDITEKKKYELEMARLDRLNLVGQMAAGIAHEIRNPMTTVRGFLQLFQSRDKGSEYSRHYKLMIEELDRANSIITEFLSLARNKSSPLKRQNLKILVKRIKPLIMADALKCEREIFFHLDDVAELYVNEKEIRQLVFNLVRNALEAVEPGGKVIISTYREDNEVVLAVRDNGHGISPEIINKIGNPFFTTKDNGTGLGLAVCYSIAKRHNATIEIDSGPGGTTFFVRFKLQKDSEKALPVISL